MVKKRKESAGIAPVDPIQSSGLNDQTSSSGLKKDSLVPPTHRMKISTALKEFHRRKKAGENPIAKKYQAAPLEQLPTGAYARCRGCGQLMADDQTFQTHVRFCEEFLKKRQKTRGSEPGYLGGDHP